MNNILVINGSVNHHGNCEKIINKFIESNNSVTVVNCYENKNHFIEPCLDCGGCMKVHGCVVQDDFSKVVSDVYDTIVVLTPIYMSNSPGPMFNLISRFNFLYKNEVYLNHVPDFKKKRGIVIIVGGGHPCKSLMGSSNEDLPIKQAGYILKKLNATLDKKDILTWLNSDDVKYEESELKTKVEDTIKTF